MTKPAPPIKKMFCCVSGWVRSTLLDLLPQLAPGSGQAWQHQMHLPHCLPILPYWRPWPQEALAVSSPSCQRPSHQCLHRSRAPAASMFNCCSHPCSSCMRGGGGSRCPGPRHDQSSSLEWVFLSISEPSVAVPLQFSLCRLESCFDAHRGAPGVRLPLQWDAVLTHILLAVPANALMWLHQGGAEELRLPTAIGRGYQEQGPSLATGGLQTPGNIDPHGLTRWPWCSAEGGPSSSSSDATRRGRKYGRAAQDGTGPHQVPARLLPEAARVHPDPFLAAAQHVRSAPATFKQSCSS